MSPPTIFSIGHSNHDIETFLKLLHQHGIRCLIDVRSSPYSRFFPHFRKKALEARLRDDGIEYVYLGKSLGGRPDDDSCYDAAGNVDYRRISRKPWYHDGVEELIATARGRRVAMMCSEEDPDRCHRQHLIAQSLLQRQRAVVQHIRRDGRHESAELYPSQARFL